MAIFTRTDSTLAPNWTQQSLYDAVKAGFANAGYPAAFSEFTSGTDRVVVYAIVIDAARTQGTAYLRIRVTAAFVIAQQLFSGWTTGTNTGVNGSTEITYTALGATIAVSFISLNGGVESKLVLISQSSVYFPLGYVSPANRPSWWDMASWNYVFIPTGNTFATYRSSALNPFGQIDNDTLILTSTRLTTVNPITNRRDILPGLVLFNLGNTGISGRTSDDFVILYGSGLTRFDVIQIPNSTNQYLVIAPGNGGLAVRVS